MAYPVYPHSPPPADWEPTPNWAEEQSQFDNGAAQLSTLYYRPLYGYALNYQNAQEGRFNTLEDFFNGLRGGAGFFLFTDPRTAHHFVESTTVGFFVNSKQGRFYTKTNSWRVIPASGSFTLHSALSGSLTQGVHYTYSQDNGFFTVFTAAINSNDVYGWQGTFYKKCFFEPQFRPRSRIWANYSFTLKFKEALP